MRGSGSGHRADGERVGGTGGRIAPKAVSVASSKKKKKYFCKKVGGFKKTRTFAVKEVRILCNNGILIR